jgi:hypothetical protein
MTNFKCVFIPYFLNNSCIYSMEHISSLGRQIVPQLIKLLPLLWTMSFRYYVQKRLPLVFIPHQLISVSLLHYILPFHSHPSLRSGSFLSDLPIKILYAFLFSLLRATSSSYHTFLYFIVLIRVILGEFYSYWNLSLYSCNKCRYS